MYVEGNNLTEAVDFFYLQSVADRVCLGLIPSSELQFFTAVRALR